MKVEILLSLSSLIGILLLLIIISFNSFINYKLIKTINKMDYKILHNDKFFTFLLFFGWVIYLIDKNVICDILRFNYMINSNKTYENIISGLRIEPIKMKDSETEKVFRENERNIKLLKIRYKNKSFIKRKIFMLFT